MIYVGNFADNLKFIQIFQLINLLNDGKFDLIREELTKMETVARKIGNSVDVIFPKDISPEVGDRFTIVKAGDSYILKPKKTDIFEIVEDWEGFRDSVTLEDTEWDRMRAES